jgi:DNA-binding Lrp family transcriptional regulator
VIHAFVLIKAEREAVHSLGGKLADVEGVTEAYSITGEWDFVAIIRLRQAEELAELVTGRLSRIRGIRETHTMVAFEVFSEHEAMFSIGA